jgi:type IV secretion system protein VirB6/type IV secretion system protein TrbL
MKLFLKSFYIIKKLFASNVMLIVLAISLLSFSEQASAELKGNGIFDGVLHKYQTAAHSWLSIIISAASYLFWALAAISMTWTFGMLLLRRADIQEFFAELIKFIVFTGFFWWLLINSETIGATILESLQRLGGLAGGTGAGVTPSSIMDLGFTLFKKTCENTSGWSPIDSAVSVILSLICLLIITLIAFNMLELMISAWFMAYAGVFFLGFGGSKWTSDIAINYYKSLLGLGAQILAMVLLIGIGTTFIKEQANSIESYTNYFELGVMVVSVLIMYLLSNKIPPMLAGIISGASTGAVGQHSMGQMLAAASMAVSGAAMAVSAVAGGAAGVAGAGSALKAAFEKATGGDGGDSGADSGGGMDGMDGGKSGGSSSEDSNAFAKANGDGGSSWGSSSQSSGSSGSGGGSQAANDGGTGGGTSAGASGGGSSGGSGESGEPSASGQASSGGMGSKAARLAGTAPTAAKILASNTGGAIADWAKGKVANSAGGRLAARIRSGGDSPSSQQANQAQSANAGNLRRDSFSRNALTAEQWEEAKDFITGSKKA